MLVTHLPSCHDENILEEFLCLVDVFDDFCIGVKSKQLTRLITGEGLYALEVVLVCTHWRHLELLESSKLKLIKQNCLRHVLLEKCLEHSPVALISHSTAIIALTNEIVESLEGYHTAPISQISQLLQLSDGDEQVTLVEVVSDVEPYGSILSTFLHHGMEEAQREQHLGNLGLLCGCLHLHGIVGAHQVGLDATWRFVGHLDGTLHHRSRQIIGGVAGQPQSEGWVEFGALELLANLLQARHPTR